MTTMERPYIDVHFALIDDRSSEDASKDVSNICFEFNDLKNRLQSDVYILDMLNDICKFFDIDGSYYIHHDFVHRLKNISIHLFDNDGGIIL